MNHTRRFFKNICIHCNHESVNPLLSDFEYGTNIFQTVSGKYFGYLDLTSLNFLNPSIKNLIEESDFNIFDILSQCSDGINGEKISLNCPICTNCGKVLDVYNDNYSADVKEIPYLTFDSFVILPDNQKNYFIKLLIDNNLKTFNIYQYVELYLVNKFVINWQLNVVECKFTNKFPISGSLIINKMEELLYKKKQYPINYRENDDFDGTLALLLKDKIRCIWKSEISLGNYKEVKRKDYYDIKTGLKEIGITLWKDCYNDVMINWNI